ncbi:MAG: tRNA uridine-5-carboxymethylaminomethyl(34) synthesis GTPase MnmE [Mariprofundaceae bacterium]|nr:tRNA uridine-5-carboxymethylaminomethyl(34) synthesis GTPase MnmE [Mariprofundaceae bacterium]
MTTIAAIATPAGRGGLGVIRISGPDAHVISQHLCGRQQPWPLRKAQFTRFLDTEGKTIDEGLVLYFKAPRSYTGEDVVELQAHGSPVLLNALLQRVLVLGAKLASPGEFTRRAVKNGKMNLEQAEAIAACIDAVTLRAARQAERHLQGEFGQQISFLMDKVTGLLAHVEACLDFPEEDVPPLLFDQLREQMNRDVLEPIENSLATAMFGERLFQGVTAAIVGAPNVGKSSLLNRLSGRERAIVSDVPGTTRDTLEVDFEVQGIPVRLVDTAGMRNSGDAIEQEGVRRARDAASMADVTIFVADVSQKKTWKAEGQTDIMVMNKCDLLEDCSTISNEFIPVSAHHGVGMNVLLEQLAQHLDVVPAGEEDILVTRERHRQLLVQARMHVLQGCSLLGEAAQLDLVALEWRQGWSALGEILGIGDVEHILDRIFSEFCIGK